MSLQHHHPLTVFYDEDYYNGQVTGSFRSAVKFKDILLDVFKPSSIADVGCGRGAWLKVFKNAGATRLVGFDGPWNSQEHMIDQSIEFVCVDLDEPINIPAFERFDLAISLEVAEHLRPASSRPFIALLTRLSDAVLFSAAFVNQGGTNHINEQKHTYWAEIFSSYDYLPYDLFRPLLWGDDNIEFWYRQNTFLYVRKNSPAADQLAHAGYYPITNTAFMNCVHPIHCEANDVKAVGTKALIRQVLVNVTPKTLLPLVQRVKGLVA